MFIIIVSSHVFQIVRTKVYIGLHLFSSRADSRNCSIGLHIKWEVSPALVSDYASLASSLHWLTRRVWLAFIPTAEPINLRHPLRHTLTAPIRPSHSA